MLPLTLLTFISLKRKDVKTNSFNMKNHLQASFVWCEADSWLLCWRRFVARGSRTTRSWVSIRDSPANIMHRKSFDWMTLVFCQRKKNKKSHIYLFSCMVHQIKWKITTFFLTSSIISHHKKTQLNGNFCSLCSLLTVVNPKRLLYTFI